MKTLKFIAAVFVGLMVAFTIIILLEKIAHGKMTVPEGIDPNTPEGAEQLINQAPVSALIWVVLGYLLGSFLGSLVAQLISNGKKPIAALVTGFILLALTLTNLYMVPHPMWMVYSSIAAVIIASFLGGWIVQKKNASI